MPCTTTQNTIGATIIVMSLRKASLSTFSSTAKPGVSDAEQDAEQEPDQHLHEQRLEHREAADACSRRCHDDGGHCEPSLRTRNLATGAKRQSSNRHASTEPPANPTRMRLASHTMHDYDGDSPIKRRIEVPMNVTTRILLGGLLAAAILMPAAPGSAAGEEGRLSRSQGHPREAVQAGRRLRENACGIPRRSQAQGPRGAHGAGRADLPVDRERPRRPTSSISAATPSTISRWRSGSARSARTSTAASTTVRIGRCSPASPRTPSFYIANDAGNLVCGPIAAEVADDKAFEQARRKIDADQRARRMVFHPAPRRAVAKAPGDTGTPVAKVGTVALPLDRLLSAGKGRRAAAAADPFRGAAAVGPDRLGAGHGRAPARDRSPLLRPHPGRRMEDRRHRPGGERALITL